LITSGSFGLGPTEELLRHLREFGNQIQVIVVCGRNETLRQRLEKQGYPFRLRLYGFVDNMNELMEASDLLIAKPGGATTTESLAKEIPMVIMEPIPGQEAGNTKLLQERNASFFLGEPGDIRVILKGILDYPEVLEEKKRSIRNIARPEAAVELARLVLEKLRARGR
jgi:processive 1,2-diacylglycerol beta-glucosyltransferase